jgi:hypothetical protein
MEPKTGRRDKRLSPRVGLRCPLRYRVVPVTEAGYSYALAHDVSPTGFRFHSQTFVPRKSGILVELLLPESSPVRSLARAVWVREMPGDDGFEIGGSFVEPPHDARTALSRFVFAHLSGARPGGARP